MQRRNVLNWRLWVTLLGMVIWTMALSPEASPSWIAPSYRTTPSSTQPEIHLSNQLPPHSPGAESYPGILAEGMVHSFQLHPWERANAVKFSPGGKWIAAATSMGVHIFDVRSYAEVTWIPTETWVRDLDFSPDGEVLAGGVFDGTVRLWQVADGSQLDTLELTASWIRDVAFSPGGELLAIVSDDDAVRVWDLTDHRLRYTLEIQGVRCTAFSPDGSVLATGSEDGSIQLWHVKDGFPQNTLSGHTGWVRTLVFSHDGEIIASGAFDATARLWRVPDGELIQTLEGHSASVLGVAFSPDDALIATGSVDSTIRLWNVTDGELQGILTGHSGFIFGVDISPGGDLVASAGEDATVKLWDLTGFREGQAQSGDLHPVVEATSSDCRVCHHPRSNLKPIPVVEVRCDACHLTGAALNWCPSFPRSAESPASVPYTVAVSGAGVPVGSQSLGVSIVSPGNGETIYAHKDVYAPLVLNGKVQTSDDNIEEVEIRLEVWSGKEKVDSLKTQPLQDGTFEFPLAINPTGDIPLAREPNSLFCNGCHEEYIPKSYLPPGRVRLIVIASAPNAQQARDERWVMVDISDTISIPVTVTDRSSGEPLGGISVEASTSFYEWRARHANAITGVNGEAHLSLEVLSNEPTIYQVGIPEQVVDGTLYRSGDSIEVTLPASSTTAPQPIEIEVDSQRGKIHGRLAPASDVQPDSIPVWAIHPPDGPLYQTEIVSGSFSFADLPVAKYLIFLDPEIMASYGLLGDRQRVDLAQSPEADVTLKAQPAGGTVWMGKVVDSDTKWLPFAWLVLPAGSSQEVDLDSGSWMLRTDGHAHQDVTVNAPGYYSQTISPNGGESTPEQFSVALQRRPEMNSLEWGRGEVLLPPESKLAVNKDRIVLESGWVWGSGEGQELVLETEKVEIHVSEGKFALQRFHDQTAWFYLFEGEAEIYSREPGETQRISSNTMVALPEDGSPLAQTYEMEAVRILNPYSESPIPAVFQPSVQDRIRAGLSRLGINTAMLVTFITYTVAVLSLFFAPIVALIWLIRRRRITRENKP